MPVFLFFDVEGSTRLREEHPEEMGEVIARNDAIFQGQIESCSGPVTKHTGGEVTAPGRPAFALLPLAALLVAGMVLVACGPPPEAEVVTIIETVVVEQTRLLKRGM